jgi:hypothetical protein
MPRYSSFGALDDQLIDDADLGFVTWNNRLRPDQLKAGQLADSQNGRMGINGEWQTRKGADLIKASVSAGGSALTLPFYVYASKNISSASKSGTTVTVNFATAHGFNTGTIVSFANLTGGTENPNGNRLITVATSTRVTFTTNTSETVTYGVSTPATAGAPILDDTAVNAVYGSCLFSNPNQTTDAYIIIATNTKALAVNLANPLATPIDIPYPSGETVSTDVSLLQAFNKVFIFREGDTAFEWDSNATGKKISESPEFTLVANGNYTQPSLITAPHNTVVLNGKATVSAVAHGLSTGDALTILDGDGIITDGSIVVVAGKDTDSFFYYVTENHSTAPAVITAATKAGGSSALVTITTQNNHGYTTNDYVKISGIGYTGTPDPNGTWKITVTSVTEFTYETAVGAQTFNVTGSPLAVFAATMQYMKKQSVGLGFCYMPAPPWAVYHQRRLWMPFYYTQATSGGATVYTSRGIRDELIVSDILDSDTYDQVYNQYRFNAGTADYVVALHPFADDKLVVFNRNSIHLVVSAPDITQSAIQLITNEVGCLARKSVIQVADNVIFLSDNGIYGTNFQDLYNLRGNGIPMSTSIQATIDRINKDFAHNAVAAYFDNRYYIAVPLDGSETNNALLVYNFLNQGWESLDTIADTNWEISDLYVGGNGSKRGLYCVNSSGGIHRLEHLEDGEDLVSTQIGGESTTLGIESSCTTRMFTYGVTDRKRFNNFELQVESNATRQSNVAITATGENIDGEFSLGTVSQRLGEVLDIGEDASIRGRLGQNRSYGLQFTLTPTQGRPRIRTIKVSASITNRALTSTK